MALANSNLRRVHTRAARAAIATPRRLCATQRPRQSPVNAAAASSSSSPPLPQQQQQQSQQPPLQPQLVRELELAVAALPGLEGVLPGGDAEAKRRVLAAVAALEAAAPFRADAPGAAASLLGSWDLVFASDGTVVTRTGPARALAALSPAGLGLRDIKQSLEGDASAAAAGAGVECSNSLTVALGLLGTWEVRVNGRWLTTHQPSWRQSNGGSSGSSSSSGDGSTSTSNGSALDSEVVFDAFGVRLVGLPGLSLQDASLPELKLPAPGGPRAPRAVPNWRTTFCDGAWRVGRGVSSKGVFVFRKATAA